MPHAVDANDADDVEADGDDDADEYDDVSNQHGMSCAALTMQCCHPEFGAAVPTMGRCKGRRPEKKLLFFWILSKFFGTFHKCIFGE